LTNYSELFELNTDDNRSPYLVHSNQIRKGFGKEWNQFRIDILNANIIPDEPIKYIYKKKSILPEYITCEGSFHFFHESLIDILNRENVTGISYYPAIIEHKKEKRLITDYWGIQISGRYRKIDRNRGEIVPYIHSFGLETKRHKGMYFTDDFWDGKDFSVSEYHSFVVVTKKVKDIFEKNNIKKNVEFICLTDFLLLVDLKK